MLGQGRASFYSHSSNCPRPGIVRRLCFSKMCLLDIISKRPELIKLLSNFLYVFGVVYFDASFFVSAGVVAVIMCSIGKIGGNCNRESTIPLCRGIPSHACRGSALRESSSLCGGSVPQHRNGYSYWRASKLRGTYLEVTQHFRPLA